MDEAANNSAGSIERRADVYKDPQTLVTYWLTAIAVAGNQEKTWRDQADKAERIFTGENAPAFNVLHANEETVIPALYNSTPTPDVRPRHNDANEVARQAGQLIERGLSFLLDEYDFDSVALASVQDMRVAGRGIARVRYKPYQRKDTYGNDAVVWQEASCEHVPWRRFRRGPGANWGQVPWVAFEVFPTRDELVALAGEEIGGKVPLDAIDGGLDEDKSDREKSAFKKARVWEIWDRDTRKVFFVAPGFTKSPVYVEPDPLDLLDFFPMPAPLQALSRPDNMVPIVPYEVYRKQAEELNRVSERILKLIEVLKFRGIRASELPELDGLSQLEDGQFAASEGALSALGGGKSLDDAIWVVPIDKLIVVIRELLVQREQIKQAIYEITGVSDIVRGATDPSETLGAQQIKAQWGSLRIQRQQREVQRFCRDLFRLKAEIIASKFSPEVLQMIAGQEIPPEVMAVLKSDVRRAYLVDIETDSTVRGDLVRAQQNMANFLQGTAQFFGAFAPLIQSGAMPPQVGETAVVLYASFARQFKLGKQAEDALAKLATAAEQAPIGQPSPEEQEAQQIGKAKAIAEVKKDEATVRNTDAKTQAQNVETAVVAVNAVHPPQEQPQGFVQ